MLPPILAAYSCGVFWLGSRRLKLPFGDTVERSVVGSAAAGNSAGRQGAGPDHAGSAGAKAQDTHHSKISLFYVSHLSGFLPF